MKLSTIQQDVVTSIKRGWSLRSAEPHGPVLLVSPSGYTRKVRMQTLDTLISRNIIKRGDPIPNIAKVTEWVLT